MINNVLRAIAISCLSVIWTLSHAATPGSYVGVGAGLSNLGTSDQDLFATNNNTNSSSSKELGGLGGRAFAGYNFNRYFGLEAGVARYAKSHYTGSMNNQNSTLDYSMDAFDLVAKTYLPIGDTKLDLYALGGVAAVNNTVKYQDGGVPFISDFLAPLQGSKSSNKIRPIYGVGASYDIPSSKATAGVELTRIQGIGDVNNSANALPPANMLSFNLSYHF